MPGEMAAVLGCDVPAISWVQLLPPAAAQPAAGAGQRQASTLVLSNVPLTRESAFTKAAVGMGMQTLRKLQVESR